MFVLEQKPAKQTLRKIKRTNFYYMQILIIISFFYCCEKVFELMNIWMIRKNLMKHHYLKKKVFKVT